jgi:hypothetical protein
MTKMAKVKEKVGSYSLYEKLGKIHMLTEYNVRSLGMFTTVSFLKMEPLGTTISPD